MNYTFKLARRLAASHKGEEYSAAATGTPVTRGYFRQHLDSI